MDAVTAQELGQYRRELIAQGFKAETAENMAADAAHILVIDRGLNVSADEVSA